VVAIDKGLIEVVSFLLFKGVARVSEKVNDSMTISDCRQFTPLMLATKRGHIGIIELLIDKGADVNEPDIYTRSTPLMIAIVNNNLKIIHLLLSRGASIYDRDSFLRSCFDLIEAPRKRFSTLYCLNKWPITMAIIVLIELCLYFPIDAESLLDLHQYLGILDEDGVNYIIENEDKYLLTDEEIALIVWDE
jgi:ankyrin repeat protein